MRILADDIAAGYDGRDVLRGISLHVRPGELVGLIGPNGAGKSTLLRALSRTLPLKAGTVRLDGEPLDRLTAREVARRVAVVPQSEPTLFEFTVREVVLMGRHPHIRRATGETQADYDAALRAMAATDTLHLADRPITSLSGGEHRRVLIARALAQSAATLLLDEPTAHLDLAHQADVLVLVRRLADRDGVAVVAALHDLNVAAEYCDRLLLLAGGRVAAEGAPDDVLSSRTLEDVYGAPMLVSRSPASGRPQVSVVPARDGVAPGENALRVHVVCGGGTGLAILPALIRYGCRVTAGVLNRLDSDHEAAVALGIPCAEEAPFSRIGAEARVRCAEMMAAASVIVVSEVPIGSGNLANLEMATQAQSAGKTVILVGDADAASRDFTDGAGATSVQGLSAHGALQVRDVAGLERALAEVSKDLSQPA